MILDNYVSGFELARLLEVLVPNGNWRLAGVPMAAMRNPTLLDEERAAAVQTVSSITFNVSVARSADGTWVPSLGLIPRQNKTGTLGGAVQVIRDFIATEHPAHWTPMKRLDRGWGEVSVSQVIDFIGCKRSWWFKQIAKAPRKATDATSFGTRLHKMVEDWVMHGRWPTVYYAHQVIDALGVRDLQQDDNVKLEAKFRMEIPDVPGLVLVGAKDFVDLRVPGLITVMDIKSHSDIEKWGVPQDKIASDLQLLIYAWEEWQRAPDSVVMIGQVQQESKEPYRNIRVVSDVATPEAMFDAYTTVVTAAVEMSRLSGQETQKGVPHTDSYDQCEKYKSRDNPLGCSHAEYCAARAEIKAAKARKKKGEVT